MTEVEAKVSGVRMRVKCSKPETRMEATLNSFTATHCKETQFLMGWLWGQIRLIKFLG